MNSFMQNAKCPIVLISTGKRESSLRLKDTESITQAHLFSNSVYWVHKPTYLILYSVNSVNCDHPFE